MKVRMEGNKVIVEFEIEEYFELYQLLKEASRYRGTGTSLLARSLLQKIKEGSKNESTESL